MSRKPTLGVPLSRAYVDIYLPVWPLGSTQLVAEYAFVLKVGGVLYTITDVAELGEWITSHMDAHPLFQKLSKEEMVREMNVLEVFSTAVAMGLFACLPACLPACLQEKDVVIPHLATATEEGQKVERNGGATHVAVYRRVAGR